MNKGCEQKARAKGVNKGCERGCEQKMGCNRPSRLYRIHRENSASYSLKKRHICIYIRDRFFVHTYLWIHWGSADGGKRGWHPPSLFCRKRLRRPRQNSPIPPRRLVCAAALPPSPYTKKEEKREPPRALRRAILSIKKARARGVWRIPLRCARRVWEQVVS